MSHYRFNLSHRPYGRVTYQQYRSWGQKAFEELLATTFPRQVRTNVAKYLPYTLYFADKYRLDPLWVLSVIWTESRFDPSAISPVGATGLMQVMIATGQELVRKKVPGRKITNNYGKKLIARPLTNIQLGAEYLAFLLKRFGSYRYATIAYNMGPQWVSKRLAQKRPIGQNNLYLEKVEAAYRMIAHGMAMQVQFAQLDYLSTCLVPRLTVAMSAQPSFPPLVAQFFETLRPKMLAAGDGDFFGKKLEHL